MCIRDSAYCVQPAKPGPGSGNYTITKIGDNQALAKVCYYGTDAAGSESFFANKYTDFSEGDVYKRQRPRYLKITVIS